MVFRAALTIIRSRRLHEMMASKIALRVKWGRSRMRGIIWSATSSACDLSPKAGRELTSAYRKISGCWSLETNLTGSSPSASWASLDRTSKNAMCMMVGANRVQYGSVSGKDMRTLSPGAAACCRGDRSLFCVFDRKALGSLWIRWGIWIMVDDDRCAKCIPCVRMLAPLPSRTQVGHRAA
jgi:hypothetical protein